jgi:hypothetical protein
MDATVAARACICATAACALVVAAGAVWAGGSIGDDDHDDGRPILGVVRDLGSGPLAEARVSATVTGTNSSFVTSTDANGKYRISGFGNDIDPKAVVVTCSKTGYKYLRFALRNPVIAPEAPIEADCLMERQ